LRKERKMKVCSVEEMRAMDKCAIEDYGIADDLLMENAGLASYYVLLKEFGIKGKKFVVICGSGNNGGDGLVVARKILSMGGYVQAFLLGDKERFKGAARKNYDIALKLKVDIKPYDSLDALKKTIGGCDAVVDGIFGTGLQRNVEGSYKDVIQLINKSNKTVFSIDIPSGINGNTGEIMGAAVKADFTVTYGLPKIGNLLYPGYENCGKLYATFISFPPALQEKPSLNLRINEPAMLPDREGNSHKGSLGDVLFIAGAASYLGAPYFSALSFLKAGGGYSRLASPSSITSFIAAKGSEIVFVPQVETESGSIALENGDKLLELAHQVDMLVLGPGLSLSGETQKLVLRLAKEIQRPLLIDGDGITAVSKDLSVISEREHPTILTPHPGEMARITGESIAEVEKKRVELVLKEAKRLNAVIVLKGAHSLIGYPDGAVYINMSGNSGMATAGSGDVLTGTIAAMFGLGLTLDEAVRTGVFLHGYAGDVAASEIGEDGITAQDILDYLPAAVKNYRQSRNAIIEDFYHSVYLV
jgi:NAD(P)H-hydrate epimerase